MERVRLGIVGCGEVVQIIHLPTLAMLPEQFAVTAVCDVSAKVREGVGERWGVAAQYADYHDLVRSPDVDAVLVTNPHAYHAETTIAACAAGKHVLVEKPMCLTLADADAIIVAQATAGVTVQVGYMRRYAAAFVEACRVVREEMVNIRLARVHQVIGRNALIIGQVARTLRGDDIPPETLEVGQALQGRMVREAIGEDAPPELRAAYLLLCGLSAHDLSAMRELLGMPRGVLYAAHRQGGRYLTAAFDYGDYVCQFDTGVDDVPQIDTTMEVYGATKRLHLRYDSPYVRNMPVRLTVTEANGAGGSVAHVVHPNWEDPFLAEWRAFYANVTERKPPKTPPADARQDLELFAVMIERMRG